jgi:hypothetical protein
MSIMPETSQTTSEGKPGRRPANEGIERRLEVRRLLRLKLRIHEIARACKVSERTIKTDLRIIRGQDSGFLEQVQREGFLHEFLTSLEFQHDLQRDLLAIAKDPQTKPYEKIMAIRANSEIEARIQNSLAGFTSALLTVPLRFAAQKTAEQELKITK